MTTTEISNKLHALSNGFREIYPEADFAIIIEKINECIAITSTKNNNEDEKEINSILSNLLLLFTELSNANHPEKIREVINKEIGSIDWDNYMDEDKETEFTLGEVWYAKLDYVSENTEDQNVESIVNKIKENIGEYFTALEIFTAR